MTLAERKNKNLSFDEVWAIVEENIQGMKELREAQREAQREADKRQAEADKRQAEAEKRQAETEKLFKQQKIEADKRHAELEKQLGKLGGRFGEMIECMVKPNLISKFEELGFKFTKVHQDTTIKDEENNIISEADFMLENGDKVMIVEVKSKPSIEDIKYHIKRMGKMRKYADLHGDKRKYLGAVAGMVVNENAYRFALKNGFFVIIPAGDTFNIIAPSGEYSPREW
ncbi:MAG: hypothetical protein Pg6A_18970 [Termitinemataceae bacterium]|nr:MAG: hypothetical protein Pg6A_18970 [Termitinemataceae bacterium]